MASRASPSSFALGLAVRAAAIGLLATAAAEVALRGRLFATALVLLGVAAVIGAGLVRAVGTADRLLGDFLSGVAAGTLEPPTGGVRGFPGFGEAMRGVADR